MAGHGVGLQQQFYFLTHEMRAGPDEEAAIREFGLAAPVLGDALRRTRALKQVLVSTRASPRLPCRSWRRR